MTTTIEPPGTTRADVELDGLHPVARAVAVIEAAATEVTEVPVAYLQAAEKREALLRLARVEAQLAGLRLRLMAAADDAAREEGARDVAALLTHHTRGEGRELRRDLALAQSLDRRWLRLDAALARGQVNLTQARVIARALDDLPSDEVDADLLRRAETHLVEAAAHHGPRELALLGRKILEVIAPERHERDEARALAREEQRAREVTSLRTARLGGGVSRIVITVPDATALRLQTYLEAFTSPRRSAGDGGAPAQVSAAYEQPMHRRLGQAFCAFLEAVDPRRLPVHGGDATTVIVTVSLDDLRRELGVASTGASDLLSAVEARRLACTARIVPAVLGGRSEVLDLGRSARLFNPAQRKAMVVRDRECRADGCTIPAAWCEAHHGGRPWSEGGRTDLADGVLLCSWHHHRAHDPRYAAARMPNGDVRFTRRE